MSKTEELKRLFDEWQHHKQDPADFYGDGILDENEWEKVSPKILYVLKEVDETSDIVYSITNMLAETVKADKWDKGFTPTWANVIRWTHGLTESVTAYHPVMHDFISLKRVLLKCATLNLKKTRGRAAAVADQVGQAAGDDKDWIMREIAVIDPDIIICCGTFDIVKWRVFHKDTPEHVLRSGNRCFKGRCVGKDYIFFNHYHPNSRTMRPCDMYNVLALSILCAQKEGLISIGGYKNIPMAGPFLD